MLNYKVLFLLPFLQEQQRKYTTDRSIIYQKGRSGKVTVKQKKVFLIFYIQKNKLEYKTEFVKHKNKLHFKCTTKHLKNKLNNYLRKKN